MIKIIFKAILTGALWLSFLGCLNTAQAQSIQINSAVPKGQFAVINGQKFITSATEAVGHWCFYTAASTPFNPHLKIKLNTLPLTEKSLASSKSAMVIHPIQR